MPLKVSRKMSRKQIILAKRSAAVLATVAAVFILIHGQTEHSGFSLAVALPVSVVLWKWWQSQLRDMFRVKKFSPVIPGKLYRSGQISRYQVLRTLRRYRIGTVVDLTENTQSPDSHQRAERDAIQRLGIDGHRFAMHGDGTGDLDAVAGAVSAIHNAMISGTPVLVHCAAGVQRTGHVLAAYLLLVEKVDGDVVFNYLERFGWQPGDGMGWPNQLNRRMGALADRLVERGILDDRPPQLPQLPVKKPSRQAPWWYSNRRVIARCIAA